MRIAPSLTGRHLPSNSRQIFLLCLLAFAPSLTGRHLPSNLSFDSEYLHLPYRRTIPNGPPPPFKLCVSRIAQEAVRIKGLREAVFGAGILAKKPPISCQEFGADSALLASRAMRDPLRGECVTEDLAAELKRYGIMLAAASLALLFIYWALRVF